MLEDKSSGMLLVEAEIDFQTWGKVCSAHSCDDVTIRFNTNPDAMKQRETMTKAVWIKDVGWEGGHVSREIRLNAVITEALKPLEIDGWQGYRDHCKNSHHRVKSRNDRPPGHEGEEGAWHSVIFVRFV